jgi:2-polyprenyl-3-methyl-5-hydroxy-6-metoxy-1,4-benzoquinol methylase
VFNYTAKLIHDYNLIRYLKAVNRVMRRVAGWGHKLQLQAEWHSGTQPEWYDHLIFQHWLWRVSRNPMSWERGVFGMLAMKHGCRVLDLCCGGGFFAHHFFSIRAKSVVSVDFDPVAIAHAKKNFEAPNVEYRCVDIRTEMPEGQFDNVVWDAAIEHFTQEEITAILTNIKKRLGHEGTLTGYTLVEKPTGKSLVHHEYEFKSKGELAATLKRFFVNVLVFENLSNDYLEERRNLYFFASDSILPFDREWGYHVRL